MALLGRFHVGDPATDGLDIVEFVLAVVDSPEFKLRWPNLLARRLDFARTFIVHIPKTGGTTFINNIMDHTPIPVWRLDLQPGDDFAFLAAPALYYALNDHRKLIIACHYPLPHIVEHYRFAAVDQIFVLYRPPVEIHVSAANYIVSLCHAAMARDPVQFAVRTDYWREASLTGLIDDIATPDTLEDIAAYWRAVTDADLDSLAFRVDLLTSPLYARDFGNILCRAIGVRGVADKRGALMAFRGANCHFIRNVDVNAALEAIFKVTRPVQKNVVRTRLAPASFGPEERRRVEEALCDEDVVLFDLIEDGLRSDIVSIPPMR